MIRADFGRRARVGRELASGTWSIEMAVEWEGIQIPIREMFYRHVSGISSDVAIISESEEKDPDIDYGARQLALEIAPLSERLCSVKLWVNECFCQGSVGRFGGFMMIPYHGSTVDAEPSQYPDRVERIVEAVLHGRVKDESWHWRSKLLRAQTVITGEGEKEFFEGRWTWLWGLRYMLPNVRYETFTYDPYTLPSPHA